MEYIVFAIAVFALLNHVASALATAWFMRRKPSKSLNSPLVTILKPLRGVDDQLERNLESFFKLDYPAFELLFCTAEHGEPALEIVAKLQERYPHVASRVVIGTDPVGLNPKVIVLSHAMRSAEGELILVSDSNVRVRPSYLTETVSELDDPEVAVVSNLVAGVGERTLGATLENLQLNGFIAPAVCLGLALKLPPCVVGKSMLIRRKDLENVGGWSSLAGVLAEDHVLGRRLAALGRKAVICSHVVETVNDRWSLGRFIERHDRWLKMRWRINSTALFFELCSNATLWALLALVVAGFSTPALIASSALIVARILFEGISTSIIHGRRVRPLAKLLLVPLRDLSLAALWLHARFSHSIQWREGQRLIVGKDTVLSLPSSGKLVPEVSPLAIPEPSTDSILTSAARR